MRISNRAKLFVLFILLFMASLAFAAVPATINYQGYLKDSAGVPVTTPTSVRFSLYSSNPARNNPVWTETKSVTPSNGIYSTQLGSDTPLTAPFDAPYYLGVKVEGDNEIPLQDLSSVPYAKRAAVADTIPPDGIGTASLADSSVTTAKIASGAVTDTQISGPISAAKLDLSSVQKKYAKVAVVAQSGGDYTNPATALADIATWCGTLSAGNPCLLKIMPGIYDLGSSTISTLPYVDIEGSGENVTIITTATIDSDLGTINGSYDMEVRYLTVKNTGTGVNVNAFVNDNVSPRMTHITALSSPSSASNAIGIQNIGSAAHMSYVTATASGGSSQSTGIRNNMSSPLMNNVTANATGGFQCFGIDNVGVSQPKMKSVVSTGKGCSLGNYGMRSEDTFGSGTYFIYAENSSFEGTVWSIINTDKYVLYLTNSRLIGPATGAGTYYYSNTFTDNGVVNTGSRMGVGTSTPSAALAVLSGNATTPGITVQAATGGQIANLQEWRDSNGVPLASVSIAGIFSGNGSGLTGVTPTDGSITSAKIAAGAVTDAKITGPISDGKLTSNIARLNATQTFSGSQTFSNASNFNSSVTFGAASTATIMGISNFASSPSFSAATPFNVLSQNLVTNLNADLLDGQHGAYYQSASNLNTGTLPSARLSGAYSGITNVGTLSSLAVSGNTSIGGNLSFTTPKTSYYNISAAAFTPIASSITYGTTWGGGNNRYLSGPAGTQNLNADVSLPHGAVLTSASCRINDASAAYDITIGLMNSVSNNWICGPVSSSGSAGNQVLTTPPCTGSTIDNINSSYMMRMLNDTACGSACSIYACTVTYTISTLP